MVKTAEKVGLFEALISLKHRRASWNALFLAIMQQCTGLTATLLFLNKLFLSMKSRGEFNMSISLSVQLINFLNAIASCFSFYP
jgi:hypothetical protein